jgi:hypothetical protein
LLDVADVAGGARQDDTALILAQTQEAEVREGIVPDNGILAQDGQPADPGIVEDTRLIRDNGVILDPGVAGYCAGEDTGIGADIGGAGYGRARRDPAAAVGKSTA